MSESIVSVRQLIDEFPFDGTVFQKCQHDHFDYSLRLVTGEIIRFNEATLSANGKWLNLSGARYDPRETGDDDSDEFPRGIDVRVKYIVWIKDAPNGS